MDFSFPDPFGIVDLMSSPMDFVTWCLCVPGWILSARTKFSWYLHKSFHVKRQGPSLSTAVFPLPSPNHDVFGSSGPGLSKRGLRKLDRARILHVLVLAMNFLHLGAWEASE